PGSKYLEFISRYCSNALSLDPERALEFTRDPASWNITSEGLTFTFDHCEFFACSEGTKQVKIPFTAMKEILNTEISLLKEMGV
ncbi:MAG TPA: RsiV family protein, partial [Pyrinomonadaceae bacterium]|nr:RsiV family protein [Pyrinomonadaceae bacterium]